jgi:pectate disaccharide-lyase
MKRVFALAAFLILVSHCGSTSSGGGPQNDAGTSGLVLTIDDDINWCSLTVDSSAPFVGSATYSFDAGTLVSLHAAGIPGFTFAYWSGTDSNTSASTTVTMNANMTVKACCNSPTEACDFPAP